MFTTVLASEFSYGTVRNKIIAGYTRVQIYLSLLITLFVFMFSVIFISSVLSFGLAGILFYYDNIGGTFINDIGSYFIALFISILIIAVYSSIVCLFTIGLNKTALSIIMPIILIFVCLILEGIYEGLIETLINNNSQTNFIDILTFLNCVNVYKELSLLNSFGFEPYQIIAYILNPL
jgi:ABC-type transport system involved in multi-copper enzyme maturation permease subunit